MWIIIIVILLLLWVPVLVALGYYGALLIFVAPASFSHLEFWEAIKLLGLYFFVAPLIFAVAGNVLSALVRGIEHKFLFNYPTDSASIIPRVVAVFNIVDWVWHTVSLILVGLGMGTTVLDSVLQSAPLVWVIRFVYVVPDWLPNWFSSLYTGILLGYLIAPRWLQRKSRNEFIARMQLAAQRTQIKGDGYAAEYARLTQIVHDALRTYGIKPSEIKFTMDSWQAKSSVTEVAGGRTGKPVEIKLMAIDNRYFFRVGYVDQKVIETADTSDSQLESAVGAILIDLHRASR